MAFDPHINLARSLVATAPSPATSGTSLTLTTGEGALFPAGTFNVVVFPVGSTPTDANAEIARATRTGDVLAIVRAQEGSTARTVVIGDQVVAMLTAKTLTDIEDAFAWEFITSQVCAGAASYDFPDLGDYSEIAVYIDDVTRSSSSICVVQVSDDNGSTFYSTSGDYEAIAPTGVPTLTTSMGLFSGSSTAARSGMVVVSGFNVAGDMRPYRYSRVDFTVGIITITTAFNAVRVSSVAGNMNAGTIYIFGRR